MNLYLVTFKGSLDRDTHVVATSMMHIELYYEKKNMQVMTITCIQFDVPIIPK